MASPLGSLEHLFGSSLPGPPDRLKPRRRRIRCRPAVRRTRGRVGRGSTEGGAMRLTTLLLIVIVVLLLLWLFSRRRGRL
jgi:hypothetical protein